MGNIGSRSSTHVPQVPIIPSQNNYPSQGQYLYPQPNRGHVEAPPQKKKPSNCIMEGQYLSPKPNMGHVEAPPEKNKPSNVIDCNKAAERFGGVVIAEHGTYPKKISQG